MAGWWGGSGVLRGVFRCIGSVCRCLCCRAYSGVLTPCVGVSAWLMLADPDVYRSVPVLGTADCLCSEDLGLLVGA